MPGVMPRMFDSPDEEDRTAEHFEPDPADGWKGSDLKDEEIADDDYAAQFNVWPKEVTE